MPPARMTARILHRVLTRLVKVEMSRDPLDGETQALVQGDPGLPSDGFTCFLVGCPQLHHLAFSGANTLCIRYDFGGLSKDGENLFHQVANPNGIVIPKVDLLPQDPIGGCRAEKPFGCVCHIGEVTRWFEAAKANFI